MLTQWDKLKATQRMQEHIEANLAEPITLASLARAAGYSQWHAARLFKEITGKPPFEYIRLRRLSAAALRLRDTPCKVVDLAFDFVFDSHEGFTRAFARQFGLPPSRFRKSASAPSCFYLHSFGTGTYGGSKESSPWQRTRPLPSSSCRSSNARREKRS